MPVVIELFRWMSRLFRSGRLCDLWLNFGCDVGWPKFNVNPTSNVNVKLMSNTDVSWRWDLVVFRLCNQNPTLSQCQIDVKYWCQPDFHFQPKCNVCLTSCPTSTWRYIDVWCLLGFVCSLPWLQYAVFSTWQPRQSKILLGKQKAGGITQIKTNRHSDTELTFSK